VCVCVCVRYSVYIFYLQRCTLLLCRSPSSRSRRLHVYMRSGKRDQTILFVYDIMHITLRLHTTALIPMEITPLSVLMLQQNLLIIL